MNVYQFLAGSAIAVVVCVIGTAGFIYFGTDYGYSEGIQVMMRMNLLGKVITICSILNIVVFFILLHYNKIMMARGIIAGSILLALITILV